MCTGKVEVEATEVEVYERRGPETALVKRLQSAKRLEGLAMVGERITANLEFCLVKALLRRRRVRSAIHQSWPLGGLIPVLGPE
jgi:hypothetical protein